MSASALFFAFGFTEHRFTPVTEDHFREAMKIVGEGAELSRRDGSTFTAPDWR